ESETRPPDGTQAMMSLSEATIRKHRLLNFCAMLQPMAVKEVEEAVRRGGRAIQCMDWMMKGEKIFYNKDARHARLMIRAETSPRRDSRVTLVKDKDMLGMRRIQVHWKMNKEDSESVRKSIELLAVQLARASRGRMKICLSEEHPWNGSFAANHHMGTTRMSEDPKQGVVDREGRVHSLANLYVAGSSVFPTCGMAHPTHTIVALTLRMADRVRKVLKA
ncbi:MAG: GMC family oxidoreductase, partial [Verrucomicrobiota bacterium]